MSIRARSTHITQPAIHTLTHKKQTKIRTKHPIQVPNSKNLFTSACKPNEMTQSLFHRQVSAIDPGERKSARRGREVPHKTTTLLVLEKNDMIL